MCNFYFGSNKMYIVDLTLNYLLLLIFHFLFVSHLKMDERLPDEKQKHLQRPLVVSSSVAIIPVLFRITEFFILKFIQKYSFFSD